MTDPVLEEVIEFVAIPLVLGAFILLTYVAYFVYTNDSDMLRSKFFINYSKFKHAIILLVFMAILLVFHVLLIFFDYPIVIQYHIQQILGLLLAVTLTLFAYRLFSVIR